VPDAVTGGRARTRPSGSKWRACAARYGVNRRRTTTLATAYDIPLRDPSKPPPGISRRWLHEQYVRRGCSSEDLGADLGLHPTTFLSWCRRYNLPVRPASPNSQRGALCPAEAMPSELQPVLTGTRPWNAGRSRPPPRPRHPARHRSQACDQSEDSRPLHPATRA
jgi:hypothetical protein